MAFITTMGNPMTTQIDHLELGQFIPLHYHYNMLNDTARMQGFKAALAHLVRPGARVLELGGGTGVLSFFAAQQAAEVLCVERNPELVATARRMLDLNPNGHKVKIIQADAFHYLPPAPVDVVICEMIHVGMLREKQLTVIDSFKKRYLEKFGGPLPAFVPEACVQAVQPVQHDFHFEGYYAPTILFQDPLTVQPKTAELANPAVFQMFAYEDAIPEACSCDGVIRIQADGTFNALRMITKNVLAILTDEQRTVDWHSQYLIVPLAQPIEVARDDEVRVQFAYVPGAAFDDLISTLRVTKSGAVSERAAA